MIVQSPDLVMLALGSQGQPPRWLGPPLEDGVHLRWAFRPSRRWPAGGFAVFRRPHLPGTLVRLTGVDLSQPILPFPELARRAVVELVATPPLVRSGRVLVEGLYQGIPVAEASPAAPLRRDLVTAELQADAMDALRLTGAPQVKQVRYVPVQQASEVGWQPLTRLCLPLTSPTYPCHPGVPNADADWQIARERIPHGPNDIDVVLTYLGSPPPNPSNISWTRLHQAMASLFGPAIPAAFRLAPFGVARDQPSAAISPVDVMLMASIDPYVARMLGLAWVDTTAVPGQLYDYRVVGSWNKDQLQAPEITVDFELDAPGRVLPETFVRDGIIVRSINKGAINTIGGAPWNDTSRGLDLGNSPVAVTPGQPAYLRLQLTRPAGEVQLYLRVVTGRPIVTTSQASDRSGWSSPDGAFFIVTATAQSRTDLIDNITIEPAPNSGTLRLVLCKVGLLPAWSPPIWEPLVWISYALTPVPPSQLPAPTGLRIVSVPTPTRELDDGSVASGPRAGVGWTIPSAGNTLLPRQAVRYVLQRQSLGNGTTPGQAIDDAWKTIMATRPPSSAASAPDVPETVSGPSGDAPYLYLDDPAVALGQVEADRFYVYRVAGVDLFGRLGAYSPPAIGDLMDTDAPPAPINVEAKYLDPADPSLSNDEKRWVNATQPPQEGVRLSWAWPRQHRNQAPDAREFRIYVQPGRLNAIVGTVTAVEPNPDGTFTLTTDQEIASDATDEFTGEWLLSGRVYFTVTHNGSGRNFTLTVQPPAPPPPAIPLVGPFTLSISPPRPLAGAVLAVTPHLDGRVTVLTDQTTSLGANALIDKWVAQDGQRFRILESAGPTLRLTVLGTGGIPPRAPHIGKFAVVQETMIDAPRRTFEPVLLSRGNRRWIDYRLPQNWNQRIDVRPITDGEAYEAFVKYTLVGLEGGSVAYAQLAVSTVDDKDYIPDSTRWNGAVFGGRPGNEGMVSAPVVVQKTLRQQPKRPDPPDVGGGLASAADYYGNSTINIMWSAQPHMRVQVFWALDEAIFAADRASRATRSNNRPDYPQLSDDVFRTLVTQPPDYGTLSDDLFQALAGLPGNEAAFGLITKLPLSTSPYRATLNGRSSNRYCFAIKLVDGAGNRSVLGWPSRPVRAPKVMPPATPVITSLVGGDRQITLTWAASLEPDLKEYRVYRADSAGAATDVATMTLVHEDAVAPGNPAIRPVEVSFTDAPVPGLLPLYYRLVAVDQDGLTSTPSTVALGRAFDERQPQPPTPVGRWIDVGGGVLRAQVTWSSPNDTLLQGRIGDDGLWHSLTGWRSAGDQIYLDDVSDSSTSVSFRLWARAATGATAIGNEAQLVAIADR